MLRLTVDDSADDQRTVKLEGQVAGPWVEELARVVASARGPAARVLLDLSAVSFVDRQGVALLRTLRSAGVELVECSGFVRGLVNGGVQ